MDKGKCQRKEPPCKYLHPPQHLREQLLQNGRNNLILRSMQMHAYHPHMIGPSIIPVAGAKALAYPTTMVPGQIPYVAAAVPQSRPAHVSHPASYVTFASSSSATVPTPQYLTTVPTTAVAQFNPYGLPTVAAMQSGAAEGTIVTSQFPGVITSSVPNKASARPDRLELTHCLSDCGGEAGCEHSLSETYLPASYQVCREFQRGTCSRQPSDCRYAHPTENVSVESGENQVTVCMDYVKNKCTRDSCRYFHPPPHLQSQIKAAQSRANSAVAAASSSGSAQAVPQVVEVVPQSKKRLRDSAEELVLPPYVIPPYKRLAMDGGGGFGGKGGLPTIYQPSAIPASASAAAAAYQQAALMQLQQQPSYPLGYSSDMMSAAYTNYLPQAPVVGMVTAPPLPNAATATTAATTSAIVGVSRKIPSNAYSVEYFDQNKQVSSTCAVKLGLVLEVGY
ncbi:hypothetical protein ACOMHN_056057 [Nucella lapillus]